MYKINLGCGKDILPDWINYDVFPLSEEVIKLDMERDDIPLPDNSVDEIKAKDVLEHLNDFIPIMNEMWRVLTPSGKAFIRVPLWPTNSVVNDPTHKRGFVPETFVYFTNYVEEGRFPQYQIKRWNIIELNIVRDIPVFGDNIEAWMSPVKAIR